jgi:hypothetical protein
LSNHLSIDIPSSVATGYVVATDELIADPERFATDLLASHSATPPLTNALQELIGSPALRIRSLAAADSPARDDLAGVAVADDDQHERLLAAKRHLLIDSEQEPDQQPRIAQQVRAVARSLATATDGLLVDPYTAQLVPPDRRIDGERDWFCLADRWLGIDCLINPGADQERPPTECSCLCLFTRGLGRFGLPDLFIDQVACAYDLAATNLLRVLAVQLLTRLWREPRPRQLRIEETPIVTPEHVWGHWGARPLFGDPMAIQLIEADRSGLPEGRHLEVLPHPDFGGTRVNWGKDVIGKAMPPVAGWQPDDPPYRIDRPAPTT